MSQDMVLTVVQETLKAIIYASAPPLLIGLIIGLIVSIFQTVTSINEQTLAFIAKILAIFISLIIFGAFMLTTLQDLFLNLYSDFSKFIQ
ncbi:MAG: flagellar type III secretion system protein FliQ [Clostridiales bacterium]|jgi:flagellar biosynthetic protein FliQ|nr:flagellar type III secretion system protein FliQ [Clostridiales bacterium]